MNAYEEDYRIEATRGTVILNASKDVIAVIVRGKRLYPYKWEEKINSWNNVSGMYKWSTVNKGLREERYILR